MTFPDEMLVAMDLDAATAAGYRLVTQLSQLQVGDRVILHIEDEDAPEVLVRHP
jgi:hypothetical protein